VDCQVNSSDDKPFETARGWTNLLGRLEWRFAPQQSPAQGGGIPRSPLLFGLGIPSLPKGSISGLSRVRFKCARLSLQCCRAAGMAGRRVHESSFRTEFSGEHRSATLLAAFVIPLTLFSCFAVSGWALPRSEAVARGCFC
jgi:hypothetical protein